MKRENFFYILAWIFLIPPFSFFFIMRYMLMTNPYKISFAMPPVFIIPSILLSVFSFTAYKITSGKSLF